MKQIVSADGTYIAKVLCSALEECYMRLAGHSLMPENDAHIRGEILAYEFALNSMGRKHVVKVEIDEEKPEVFI